MVLQARTRTQIRQAIGYNILGSLFFVGSGTNSGDTAAVVDAKLLGGDDQYNGWWLVDPGADEIVRITDFVDSTNTLTHGTLTNAIGNGGSYELWGPKYPPAMIQEFINQAIIDATGAIYDPEEDITLFADGVQTRFEIPSEFQMLNRVEYRAKDAGKIIHDCERLFDENEDGDFTQTLETEDKKLGGSSLRLKIAGSASANDFVGDSFTALDIRDTTHFEMWIKCSVSVTAGQFDMILMEGVQTRETLSVPALVADTWTYIRVELANPELDDLLDTIRFRYTSDIAACFVWLDDIKAVQNDKAIWKIIPKRAWGIDKEARTLVFTTGGRDFVGYSLLKLRGGDRPALLTTDASTSEIPDQYVIAYATAHALMTNPEEQGRAGSWLAETARLRRQWPLLVDVRRVA